VLGGQGQDTLIGGLGDNQYYISGWGNTIVQGATGVNTVTTWMSYTLPDNIQNLNITGDYLYAAGNALDNLITVGDSNNMTLYGAGGNNVLVGGAGTDTFVIDSTAGSNAIYNWHAGDTVRLMGGAFTSFAQVQAAMSQQGSDVVLHNGQNDVVIRNTTISQFQANDFLVGLDHTKLGVATFDDEFNSLSLHSASNPTGTWTPNYWYGGLGSYTLPGNGELQLYTAPGFTGTGTTDLGLNPFSISNGVLDIHAQTVTADQSAAMWNYQYSSGVITTHDTFAQTYGYFEMRAELPTDVAGAWPAFWLVPADGSWPPELDVMETLTGQSEVDYTTVHSAASGSHTAVGSANLVTNVGGYHTYGVLWTATDLTWYLDGQAVFHAATPADMNQPMYMIANMAIGGWAGTPNFTSTDMKVDYIRAYALADGSSTWTSSIAPQAPDGTLAASDGSSGSVVSPPASTSPGPGATTVGSGSTTSGAVSVSDAAYTVPDGVSSITLTGSHQTITGNGAGDTFVSNNSGNTLIGGAGDDTFVLGRGGDWATGGAGADTFQFTGTPWAVGHITDFTPGQDAIDLSGLLAASGYTGSNAVADGYIKIVADAAGAQIWSNLEKVQAGLGWWEATVLDGVSADSLHMQGGLITGATAPSVAAPSALSLSSVLNGYVNAASDVAGQTLSGVAQAGAAVAIYDGTRPLGASAVADANGNWSVSLGVLANGAHSLTAIATNGTGVASAASAALAFTVDTQPPAAPTNLADSSVVSGYVCKSANGAGQALTGSAEAGATVVVFDGSTALGNTTADANGKWSFTLGQLADGHHAVTATAIDAAGNVGASSTAFGFVVDTVAPIAVVSNVIAANNATVITGLAEAGSTVSITDNGKAIGSAMANASGVWTFNASFNGQGVHSIAETALDAAGNFGTSQGVTLYSAKAGQTLTGGAGADVLIGRSGDTLTGGAGADHFIFNPSFGKETINDFTPGTDQIHIDHAVVPDFMHLLADAKQVGADLVISATKTDVLTLHNVALSTLHGGDFLFF
jgi:beta-glucanase (GH16 family)